MQIIIYIKSKISNGEWTIGSPIPSQRMLAKMFNVNRSTVITALDELMADGLVTGIPGKGTVVTNNTWTLMGKEAMANWGDSVSKGIHEASMSTVQKINDAESDSGLIQLSKGELSPNIFPLEQMKLIMREVSEQLEPFGYEEPKGNPSLREAVSNYLENRGMKVSPSSILIVSGALQALHLISIGLLQKGADVMLEQPSYLYSLSVFQSAGMNLCGLPMDREGLKPEALKQMNEHGKNVLYTIPSFHNPTGVLMTNNRRMQIIKACEHERLPIIEDDVYRDLWIDTPPPLPLKTMDRHGNVLYLGSLSKSLSPGLRIGWLVGPEAVIARLADLKMQSDYGSSSLSQQVAAKWLSSGAYDTHIESVRKELRERRNIVLKYLEKHLGQFADWDIPAGGFFIRVRLRPEFRVGKLFQKAYASGVLLNPGSIYAERDGQYFRISFAYDALNRLEEGIQRIGMLVRS
ncbi:PLP-dependent aminotransferase family protein [Aciduricibacillus chroicocephali]|uniref:PLP-dependent aminotransferase family protein n=1 Tax=Aciduricibacillus chroicocephali TaxID=3054939 RepID=A0ABY9KZX8_9BACI|nr:PLP-dependent aminotransferase family protein [Bacillaceae bacterium 44XB]